MAPETARLLARLRSLLADGKTLEQAGRDVRKSKSSVHRLANQHGITARRRRALPERTDAQIRQRLKEAKSTLARIAALCRRPDGRPVSKYSVWKRSQELLESAGKFRPRGIRVPRRCPRHGLVKLWPCVACAAERAPASQR